MLDDFFFDALEVLVHLILLEELILDLLVARVVLDSVLLVDDLSHLYDLLVHLLLVALGPVHQYVEEVFLSYRVHLHQTEYLLLPRQYALLVKCLGMLAYLEVHALGDGGALVTHYLEVVALYVHYQDHVIALRDDLINNQVTDYIY
jgi:hypothetical protein